MSLPNDYAAGTTRHAEVPSFTGDLDDTPAGYTDRDALLRVLLQSWPESRDDPVFILLGSLRASVLRQPRTPD